MNQVRVAVSLLDLETLIYHAEKASRVYTRLIAAINQVKLSVEPLPSPHPETLEHEGERYKLVFSPSAWSETSLEYGDLLVFDNEYRFVFGEYTVCEYVEIAEQAGAALYRPIPKPKAVEVAMEFDGKTFSTEAKKSLVDLLIADGYIGKGTLKWVPEGAEEGKEGGE